MWCCYTTTTTLYTTTHSEWISDDLKNDMDDVKMNFRGITWVT